jgi:hypothetical protein
MIDRTAQRPTAPCPAASTLPETCCNHHCSKNDRSGDPDYPQFHVARFSNHLSGF